MPHLLQSLANTTPNTNRPSILPPSPSPPAAKHPPCQPPSRKPNILHASLHLASQTPTFNHLYLASQTSSTLPPAVTHERTSSLLQPSPSSSSNPSTSNTAPSSPLLLHEFITHQPTNIILLAILLHLQPSAIFTAIVIVILDISGQHNQNFLPPYRTSTNSTPPLAKPKNSRYHLRKTQESLYHLHRTKHPHASSHQNTTLNTNNHAIQLAPFQPPSFSTFTITPSSQNTNSSFTLAQRTAVSSRAQIRAYPCKTELRVPSSTSCHLLHKPIHLAPRNQPHNHENHSSPALIEQPLTATKPSHLSLQLHRNPNSNTSPLA